MSTLSVDHLLGIKHLTKDDIHLIFETADHFKQVGEDNVYLIKQ